MRLPQRIRGVVIGVATLFLGPLLAAVVLSPATGHRTVAVTSPTPIDAIIVSVHTHGVIPELAERETPTPAPTPVPPPPTPVPKPRVVPPAISYAPGSIDAIIMAAAQAHGVDGAWMIRIARCESGERPTAVSSNGLYFGLFQFLQSTFHAHGGTDIFDPVQQSNIAASMLAAGQAHAWPVCSQR